MVERKKPTVLTPQDWWLILDFERQVDEALKEGDYKRISVLYSRMRYSMCALVEWEQRYNQLRQQRVDKAPDKEGED